MKFYIISVSLLLLSALPVFSQKVDDSCFSRNQVYQIMETDTMPIFKGGYGALLAYIDTNFVYPAIYNETSIQGKIICKFIVSEDGSISNVKILQGLDKYMDDEVLKIISCMPKWLPGKRKDKAVKVEYFLPVVCRIK